MVLCSPALCLTGLRISDIQRIKAEHIGLAQIKNLLIKYARYERLIDSFIAASRRGTSNTYCGSLISFEHRIDAATSMNTLTQTVCA